ncbi:hypothetical protein HOI18_01445 [Candidatus Uhrbacteria bacterium]|nr:hypothetical protein [Candidatus Uhrbacteria bacterium]
MHLLLILLITAQTAFANPTGDAAVTIEQTADIERCEFIAQIVKLQIKRTSLESNLLAVWETKPEDAEQAAIRMSIMEELRGRIATLDKQISVIKSELNLVELNLKTTMKIEHLRPLDKLECVYRAHKREEEARSKEKEKAKSMAPTPKP